MVASRFEPVSWSGTGNTLSASISSRCAANVSQHVTAQRRTAAPSSDCNTAASHRLHRGFAEDYRIGNPAGCTIVPGAPRYAASATLTGPPEHGRATLATNPGRL